MVSKVRQAVIMVGGQGTRLRPLTETRPKPILPILDKPCLCYLIEALADVGVEEVILACCYRSSLLEEAIGDGSKMGVSVKYSYEDEPRGTMGAVRMIYDMLDPTFIAVNGDTFGDLGLSDGIKAHFDNNAVVTMSLTQVKNPCESGIVRLDDTGRIVEYKEKPKPEEVFSNLINAGAYIMNKTVLDLVPPDTFFDYSKNLVPLLLEKDMRIQGYMLKKPWIDIGHPFDYLKANLTAATEFYKDYSWGSKSLEASDIKEPFYMGEASEISKSELYAAIISKGSKVTSSDIGNSLILENCEIDHANIENSILAENCKVSSGAKIINSILGAGTVVKENEVIVDNKVQK